MIFLSVVLPALAWMFCFYAVSRFSEAVHEFTGSLMLAVLSWIFMGLIIPIALFLQFKG